MGAEQSAEAEAPAAGYSGNEGVIDASKPVEDVDKPVETGAATAADEGASFSLPRTEAVKSDDIAKGAEPESTPAKVFTRGYFSNRANRSPLTADGASTPSPTSSAGRKGLLSWRPFSFRITPRSAHAGRQHSDPTRVTETTAGLSLRAAINQPAQIKQLLLKYGADAKDKVNERDQNGDRYPLHWAAARGHLLCLEMLLDAGADTSLVDADGNTPADVALNCQQAKAHGLLEFGPTTKDPKSMLGGMSAISLHCALNQPDNLQSVLAAAKSGDPDKRDPDGDRCPVHWAAARGNLECLEQLIEYGVNVAAVDASNCTASALAMQLNQRLAHKMLMEAVSDPLTPKSAPLPAGGAAMSPTTAAPSPNLVQSV